jgi:PAS domain S-box-containing protein
VIPWPQKRAELEKSADELAVESDILWAMGGLVPEALIGLDGQGLVRVWNPASEDLFGWKAEEVIGKPLPIVPLDQLLEHETLCAEARANHPQHDVRAIRRCNDGRLVRVDLSIAGMNAGVAISARPVSMPVRSTVSDHSQPGPIPTDLHLHGLAAVGRQVAAVTHDFNNLLTIIGGSIEGLLEQIDLDDSRRSVVEMLSHATGQATSICRGLLDLARIQASPKHPCDQICDLSAVVSSHSSVIEGLIGSERALVLGLTDHPVEIAADPVRIGQILLNLAANARDAMPEGGTLAVEVEIQGQPDPITNLTGPAAVLTVSDTGVGMDTETLARAFEPFFTTKPPGAGTGLGLANVAEIVSVCGGAVLPESAPGTGTTVRIFFPLVN